MHRVYILNSFALPLNMLSPLRPTLTPHRPKIDPRTLKRVINDLIRRRQEQE